MRISGRTPTRAAAMIGCGVLAVLANPPHDLWWLSFVMFVPWLWAIEGLAPVRAFLFGWLAGIVGIFFGFLWINELLVRFSGFPVALSLATVLLFAGYQGLQFALPAALLSGVRRLTGWGPMLLAPLCWVTVEAILPSIFPVYIALLWSRHPLWIQTAELGGVTMVSFSLVAVGTAIYVVAYRAWHERRLDRPAAIVSALLLVAIPGYGALRMHRVDEQMQATPTMRVGVVQGNMSIEQMGTRGWPERILTKHQRMSTELESRGARLIVWGETAYPNGFAFTRTSTRDLPRDDRWRVRRGFTSPLVFGLITTDVTGENPYPWNSAAVLNPDDTIGDVYDKVYLLVFGEYVPIVDPEWFLDLIPSAAHLNRGTGPGVLRSDGWRFGALICYEDILPRYARTVARQGIHAFLNLTNDAWFGKTSEPAQHLALAIFRTVEHRRAMVRAVNTGISAYIDPTGRVVESTRVVDPEVDGPQPAEGFVADVPLIDPMWSTPYASTGELFDALVIIALAGVSVHGIRRRRQTTPRRTA